MDRGYLWSLPYFLLYIFFCSLYTLDCPDMGIVIYVLLLRCSDQLYIENPWKCEEPCKSTQSRESSNHYGTEVILYTVLYIYTSCAVGLRPTRHSVAFFSRFALAKRKYASAFGLEALNNFGVMKQH